MKEKQYLKIMQKIFNGFVVISLSIMVTLVFINVIMRYVFNTSIPEAEELSRFFFIWTIFLGIIVAYKDNEHVAVTLLVDKLKGIPKLIFNVISYIAVLFTMGVILIGGINYTKLAYTYKTAATGTNFAFISISIVVMAIAIIGIIFRNIYKSLQKKREGGY
ncbi:TRAP transporter small permease [Petroclostridium xylanilyticum]|uniref:TRAP transporter small permease n=1 Tax=Petroclostridium xylanilyticum TaxID=1792311 RepID=UPI000B97ECEE|nr:TRAP transporter small permease [Petroclostridium xylanilyticum]